MRKIHSTPAPVNQTPFNRTRELLPIVAQMEVLEKLAQMDRLDTLAQTGLEQKIKRPPAHMSAIAYREAIWRLSKTERLVYDYLYDLLQARRRAGDRTGIFPSREHIALAVGCCVGTVQRAFTQFRVTGLLAVIPHPPRRPEEVSR